MNNYKITLYQSNGQFIDNILTKDIENFESIKVSQNIGGGQGEIDFTIQTNYDNQLYQDGQLIEIVLYNENYKTGKLFGAGYIKNINRTYSQEEGDNIEIEILGLGSLLGDYQTTFNFSGALNVGITNLINSFHSQYNITNNVEFIGNNIFKNWISNTTNISINKQGTYFDILKEMIEIANKTFTIRIDGVIILGDQSTNERIYTINNEIVNLKISSSRQTEILLDGIYDVSPGDLIILQNINSSFNLNGQRIEKVEIGFLNTTLYLGEIWDLAGEIIKK